MTGRRTARALAAGLLAMVATSAAGCTQVAQLRPVAGAEATAVRTATSIVLVEQDVAVDVFPECTFADPLYTCVGTTDSGDPIRSTAEVVAPYGATTDEWGAGSPPDISLVVEVDGSRIYDGTVQGALVRQGQT